MMTALPVALIDLDDTLLDSLSMFLNYYEREHNIHVPFHDLKAFGLHKYEPVQHIDNIEMLEGSKYIERGLAYPHTHSFLELLRSGDWDGKQYQIVLVTHRAEFEETPARTLAQLERVGIKYTDFHQIKQSQCKLEYFEQRFGRMPDLVVEDNVGVLEAAKYHGVKTMVQSRPWNTNVRSDYRVCLTTSPVPFRDGFQPIGVVV